MPRGWRTLDAGRCCRLRGCNVRSLPVRPQNLNFKALTNFLFLRARAGCRRLWSCRAARGLYGRVARQHTLTLGLWDVCAPLSSVRGGRPDSGPLEACFVGTKPGNRARRSGQSAARVRPEQSQRAQPRRPHPDLQSSRERAPRRGQSAARVPPHKSHGKWLREQHRCVSRDQRAVTAWALVGVSSKYTWPRGRHSPGGGLILVSFLSLNNNPYSGMFTWWRALLGL